MKIRSIIVTGGMAAFLLFLSIGTLAHPDGEFSANENRYLQERPKVTVENILSGRFATQSEAYLSDQIIGREGWVGAKSGTEAALGIYDINGVYLCKDGRVVERHTETDFSWDRYEANLQQIAELKEKLERSGKEVPVELLMVPTAAYIYQNQLPDYALTFDEEKAFGQARDLLKDSFIDVGQAFLEGEEDTFFRTDHHWTGYGAFLAYKAYMTCIGRDVSLLTYREENPQVLTTAFQGTLYSKILLGRVGTDSISTPEEALTGKYKVTIEGQTYDSLYFMDYLTQKDKYAVYFGGNYDRVDLYMEGKTEVGETGDGETDGEKTDGKKTDGEKTSGEKLLLIKDSFANSLVPYMLGDFSQITMVDTRYYRGDISALAEEYDRVLLVYSITNLAEETLSLHQALLQ